MTGKGLRLYKNEKLCSVTAIDRLFAARLKKDETVTDAWGEVGVSLCYPLRVVFGVNPRRGGAPLQFLISVPKKRLRHAVDRVKMRRRIREAYRQVRGAIENISENGVKLDVAFIYVADGMVDYNKVLNAMQRLLPRLVEAQSLDSE